MIPLPKVITRKILLEFLKRLICMNLEKKIKVQIEVYTEVMVQ